MLTNFGPWHWLVLAVLLIVIFGSKKLPDAARSLGKSLRIFKSEVRELQHDAKSDSPATDATQVKSERVEQQSTPPSDPSHTDARPA
jgi:sec-independent protein translocase protein TatA